MNNIRFYLLVITILFSAPSIFIPIDIHAIEKKSDNLKKQDLFDLSLEELLNVKVYSPTKSNISIQKSPGVIRVFTQKDFERFGFRTLKDVLATVPGIQLPQTYKNHHAIWVRGIQTRYNSKVLLIVDGIPIRDSYYGHFDVDSMVSLGDVERIEILNGPGSVNYGVNAFSGIINVFTKNKGKSARIDYSAVKGYGYDSENPGSKFFHSFDTALEWDISNFYLYGKYQRGAHFNPEIMRKGDRFEHDMTAEKRYVMTKFNNNSFTFLAAYNDNIIPSIYYSYSDRYYRRMPVYSSLNYKKDFKKFGNLKSQVFFQYHYYSENSSFYKSEDEFGDPIPFYSEKILEKKFEEKIPTMMYGADINYSYSYFKKNTMTLGLSYLHDQTIDKPKNREKVDGTWGEWEYLTQNKIKNENIGVYIQDIWDISKYIALTAGLRYDYLSNFKDQFNYRLGLTGQTTFNLYGKLLYGTAFKVPNYREYLKTNLENPDIKPEKMNTLEIQMGYLATKFDFNITFYYNIYKNFINEISIIEHHEVILSEPDEYYMNFNRRDIIGLEINFITYPLKNLSLNFNSGIILKATEEMGEISNYVVVNPAVDYNIDKKNLFFLSKYMINVLASYRFLENYLAGFNIQFGSKRDVPDSYHSYSGISDELRYASVNNNDAYWSINLHASANLYKGLNLYFKINNLFDQRIYSPNYSKVTYYDSEWPGISFELSLKYIF